MSSENGSWNRYEFLVLSELKKLSESQEELKDTIQEIKLEAAKNTLHLSLELNTLKVKSALLGSVAGAGIAAIVSLLVGMILRMIKF